MKAVRSCLFLIVLLAGVVTARNAQAHFQLLYPPTWTMESALGDPQKTAPCGGEGGTPTGAVTTFQAGQTITVKWVDTVYHAGHFRIAFATDRSQFADPMVTLDSNMTSTDAVVENPPVPPVLLDNLFPRTDLNGSPGTMFQQDVTLPNMACTKCTLQVIQFMLGHGPPNYIYHHCADINLTTGGTPDGGVTGTDASVAADVAAGTDANVNPPGVDAGVDASVHTGVDASHGGTDAASAVGVDHATNGTTNSSGGGCSSASGAPDSGALFGFLLAGVAAALLLSRRRTRT